MNVTASKLLILVAVVIFVLAAFGVTVGSATELEEIAAGLAVGFAASLVP